MPAAQEMTRTTKARRAQREILLLLSYLRDLCAFVVQKKTMLTLSTTPTPGNLLRQALLMLEADNPRVQDAFEIALMVGSDIASLELLLSVSNLFSNLGHVDRAEKLLAMIDVERAYNNNIKLNDVFTHLARIKTQQMDYCGALDLIKKDLKKKRLSNNGHYELALALGRVGDFEHAESVMEVAYQNDTCLVNGFSQLGWCRAVAPVKDWTEAERLILRDFETGRITYPWQSMLVNIWCVLGKVTDAQNLVESVYSENQIARDMYAKLGWTYALASKDYIFFKKMIEKDVSLKRDTDDSIIYRIYYLACIGSIARAWDLALDFLEEYPKKNYFLPTLGWLVYKYGDKTEGCKIMDYSFNCGCMPDSWLPSYATALHSCGRLADLSVIIEKFLKVEYYSKHVFIGFPLFPDNVVSISCFRKMQLLSNVSRKI